MPSTAITAIGALPSVAAVPSKVGLPNSKPAFGLGSRSASRCPNAVIQRCALGSSGLATTPPLAVRAGKLLRCQLTPS